MIPFVVDDGGRALAGFKGQAAGDCVVRAIAIASGRSYTEVYDAINVMAKSERPRSGKARSSARTGVFRRTYEKYLKSIGAVWTSTMGIGTGCKVHLVAGEVPSTGRHVVRVSRHMVALVDGVVHDLSDPSREGYRCVYGYYSFPEVK